MKKIYNLFLINKKIKYLVIILHVVLICFLLVPYKKFIKKPKKNIVVKNIILQKPQKQTFAISTNKVTTKASVKPKTLHKKIAAKKPLMSISQPKNDLAKIATNLEKQLIVLNSPKALTITKKNILTPKTIDLLNINKKQEIFGDDLNVILIKELKNHLKLPEYGSVKISFNILPNGTINNVNILEYQSFNNQKYLKNSLSEISFKNIGVFDEPKKFVVIFKNE